MIVFLILSIAGLLVSLYGFYVELKLAKNPEYKPMCDISDMASCTKPFKSDFGKMLGVSNTLLGVFFYAGIALLTVLGYHQLVLIGVAAACIFSLFLAYILYFKIQTLCLICTVTYAINAGLLIASWFQL